MNTTLIIIIAILVLWSVWGYFSSRVEQAVYVVLRQGHGYEVRRYPTHLVAQTTVLGSYDEALRNGFRIIAAYIFGNNVSRQTIAMTAPVTEQQSEKVAMTAPVMAEIKEHSRTIAFIMPGSYTLETLPIPKDDRVKIAQVSEQNMAVLRFSWFRSERRVERKKAELLSLLRADDIQPIGVPIFAGYNAPWTPPWFTRNEVLVQIP